MSQRANTPGDGEPEMEVIPMRKPMPRRRSGLAEEPIESGEIVPLAERRSLIVRSEPGLQRLDEPQIHVAHPAVRVVEQPTHAPIAPAMPQAPTKRRPWLWLVPAVLPAIAGIVLTAAAGTSTVNTNDLAAAAALVGTTLDGEARGAQVRVEAIATSSMLRAGIVTDAKTLANMVRDKDIVLPVKPGEDLEVFQLVNNKRTLLLKVPVDGAPFDPPPAGKSRFEARIGDKLAVITTATIPSPEPKIGGEVALAMPIDLTAIQKRLADRVDEAVITGLTIPVVLIKSNGRAGAVVTLPITTTVGDSKLALTAIIRPQTATGASVKNLQIGAFGLAGLFVVIFFVVLLRR